MLFFSYKSITVHNKSFVFLRIIDYRSGLKFVDERWIGSEELIEPCVVIRIVSWNQSVKIKITSI